MQFIQSKIFKIGFVVVPCLALLMVPLAAGVKTLRKNSDDNVIVEDMNLPPATPAVIQKDEEVEQVEYVYITVTPAPTMKPTAAPSTTAPLQNTTIIITSTSQPTVKPVQSTPTPRATQRSRNHDD